MQEFDGKNLMVRDGTSRYFRWRRKLSPCRECKIPKTEVTGNPNRRPISRNMMGFVQAHMHCGCHVQNSTLSTYYLAMIGGKRFHAGEKVSLGNRCGSVVTMVSGDRSIYGLVHNFVRVVCTCDQLLDGCPPLLILIRIP